MPDCWVGIMADFKQEIETHVPLTYMICMLAEPLIRSDSVLYLRPVGQMPSARITRTCVLKAQGQPISLGFEALKRFRLHC